MSDKGEPEKEKYYKVSGISPANFVGMVARHSQAVGFLDSNHDAALDKFFIKPNVMRNLAQNGVTDFGTELRPDKEEDVKDIDASKKYRDQNKPDSKVVAEALKTSGKYNVAAYSLAENNGMEVFAGDTSKGYEGFEQARRDFREAPTMENFKNYTKETEKRIDQDPKVGKAMKEQAKDGKLAYFYGIHHSDKRRDLDEATNASTIAITDKTEQKAPGEDPISHQQYDVIGELKSAIKSGGSQIVKPPAKDKADSVINANNDDIYISGSYMKQLQERGVKFEIGEGYKAEFKGDLMHEAAKGMKGVKTDDVTREQGTKERPAAGEEQSAGTRRR